MTKKKKQEYGYQTIGSLIQSLKDLVEDNAYLDMDSPIFISDYNMSKQNFEFSVLPTFSSLHHTAGVCLFHSLNEPVEEVRQEKSVKEEETYGTMKFAKWFKE